MAEPNWKYICFRFIGRNRRFERVKKVEKDLKKKGSKYPEVIFEGEKELIQKAYNEMRDACLNDPEFTEGWKISTTQ